MFNPPRVLYVTISNWGVGDELALTGTHRLMREALPGHLTFYAEKNEAVRALPQQPFKWDIWTRNLHAPNVDLIVHAGGNQWSGPNHADWETRTVTKNVPVLYLGVGMWNSKSNVDRVKNVLARCPLFIGRDEIACKKAEELGATNVHRLCCPSLFIEDAVPLGDKVGIVYQAKQVVGPHSCGKQDLQDAQAEMVNRVSDRHPSLIICHFIGDFHDAVRRFPKWKSRIVYSRLLGDYVGWYKQCGRILSMRLHGAYLGATLGRPTACLKAGVPKICALKHIGVPVVHPAEAKVDGGTFSDVATTERLKAGYLAEYRRLLKGVVA